MPAPESSSDSFEQFVAPLRAEYSQLKKSIGDRDKEIDSLKHTCDSLRDAYETLKSNDALQNAEFSVLDRRRKSLGDISLPDRSDPRVVVLLDGDGVLFDENFVSRGEQGGLDAARQLSDAITSHLKETLGDEVVGPRLRIWMFGFLNLNGLAVAYSKANVASFADVKHFIRGFTSSSVRNMMVDVGGTKDAADDKIKALLDDYVSMPTTLRVYFGGCHDNGYGAILRTLITDGYKDKIFLLQGYRDMASDISKLGLTECIVPGLFRPEKIPPKKAKFSMSPSTALDRDSSNKPSALWDQTPLLPDIPASDAGPSVPTTPGWAFLQPDESLKPEPKPVAVRPSTSSSATNALMHGRSASDSQLAQGLQRDVRMRTLDPKKSYWQYFPTPCIYFVARGYCKRKGSCKHSHEYDVTEEDRERILREYRMQCPCAHITEDNHCNMGNDCIYGHVCPQGPNCAMYKKGNCPFASAYFHV